LEDVVAGDLLVGNERECLSVDIDITIAKRIEPVVVGKERVANGSAQCQHSVARRSRVEVGPDKRDGPFVVRETGAKESLIKPLR
jgi:hypothetical protein